MMDRFSPTFRKVFCRNIKSLKQSAKLNFLFVGFTLFLSLQAFLAGIKMGVNIVCTSLLTGNHDWGIS